jgi:outer membrane biosynthesis protein TonB
MPFWTMLKEGNDHFLVTHIEPKVDVCDRHYVFDAQPPANSTKPLVFSPTGHCPAYEVPQEIAGPALEKQRNDEYQLAQLIKDNVPVAPVVMGTDGGMNRVFVGKLQTTDVVADNDGHLHAPPVHPGMSAPTLSGPREDPMEGMVNTASSSGSSSGGLFGGLFNKSSSQTTTVASSDSSAPDHSGGLFGNLFKPQTPAAQQAPAPQGTALAGLTPVAEPRKIEQAKAETPKAAPQRTETHVAETPKLKTRPQQDSTASLPPSGGPSKGAQAAAQPSNSGGLIKGAQPVVPAGTFDGRWAGLQ